MDENTRYWTLDGAERAVIGELAAPRLFAVCELERDDMGELLSGTVQAWGMEFPDRVLWASPSGTEQGVSESVDAAVRRWSATAEVGLVWP
ncbi:hypothetical protein JOF41_005738 [Saccharothrix coeruleofusca]|uniref:hypothetical protein n=1 Tax=Saccharothrix coeruleofusca TaxID=33919 RepID=UPI001AE47000|nr:hypothetical protein [Saccharothrix coeruleofusca]MBP2339560.1 hypothetical protein [Saccharothrix coeruleofusca]